MGVPSALDSPDLSVALCQGPLHPQDSAQGDRIKGPFAGTRHQTGCLSTLLSSWLSPNPQSENFLWSGDGIA